MTASACMSQVVDDSRQVKLHGMRVEGEMG